MRPTHAADSLSGHLFVGHVLVPYSYLTDRGATPHLMCMCLLVLTLKETNTSGRGESHATC
jgi:hypothetical protein